MEWTFKKSNLKRQSMSRIALVDATNTASAASKIVRTHTKFDEDGEVSEVTKTEVASQAVPPADAADDVAVPTEEEPESEVHAAADVEAEATEEGDPVDDEVMAAKMAYRDVPSLFNTEKERSAKFCGTHTRFPEDDDGEEDGPAAPVSAEMQASIDSLSSAASAMFVDAAK